MRISQRCSRQIHLNVTNICEISIEHGNYKNEASDNTGSSTIKVKPFLTPKSKIFKVNSSTQKFISKTSNKTVPNQLN